MDRRKFITASGLIASSTMLGACGSHGPESARGLIRYAERMNERLERRPLRRSSRDVPPDAPLAGNRMPAYSISDPAPVWDPALHGTWALQVDGLVGRPLRLTLDDLVRMPAITQRVNHYCVEGWNVVTEYSGVRVSRLASLAGVLPDAGYVDFRSFDEDYHESWDIESAMHPQTIIAFAREGRFLSSSYGAPARLHSPIKLGYKSVKYLTHVTFLPARNGGYWSDLGYEWFAGV